MKARLALLAAAALVVPTTSAYAEESPTQCIPTGSHARILFYQDSHEFSPVTRADGERGGISRLATVLSNASIGDESTDIVFGGDLAGGTLFGGFYKGTPFIEAMNTLGVDVAAFGQHDFDFGADHTRSLVKASSFTWVSSNLTNTDGSPFVPTTNLVRTVGGVKVGYLALTSGMSTTSASAQVREQELVASAEQAAEALRTKGAEAIVALGQISADEGAAVMEAVPSIDVMLREESSAAGTGSVVYIGESKRPILEAYGDYGNVYSVDLTPTSCGVTVSSESVLVNADVPADPATLPLEEKYVGDMESALAATVTTSDHAIERPEGGALVARAYRDYMGTQLGWQNGGGVRAVIPHGDVTLRDLRSVLPFDNKVVAIEATGAQIIAALEQGANSSPSGSGGYPRTSGFNYQYVPSAAEGQRIVNVTLDDGTPLDPAATYTLALTKYVLGGGNNVTAFADAKVTSTDIIADVDTLIAFAKAHAVLPASPITGTQLDALPEEDPTTPTDPSSSEPSAQPSQGSSDEPVNAPSTSPTQPSSSKLPFTGANTGGIALAALVALVGGFALRRRTRS
ncbi:bifunctional metallophosphatase/5'-nucleotidase [Arcanobacterium haemolyticum]|nr:bifunctional metallophosphatase/5'-nucleotidase [Arcanobacterium haemolyticum]